MSRHSLLLGLFAVIVVVGAAARSAGAADATLTFNLGICCTAADGTSCAAPVAVCTAATTCPAAFPVCAGTGGSDAAVSGSGAAYPPAFGGCNDASAYLIPERSFSPDKASYKVTAALIAWDTSALPDDAVITGATLRIFSFQSSNVDQDARQIVGDWYDWDQPVAGCDSSDFTTTPANDAFGGVSIGSLQYGYNNLTLNDVSRISRTGPTYVRLQVSGGQPSKENRALFAARDNAQVAGPALVVSYRPPLGCLGACVNSMAVTVADLVTMINITLGNSPGSACEAGDANGDGIGIDELLTAVHNALNGC